MPMNNAASFSHLSKSIKITNFVLIFGYFILQAMDNFLRETRSDLLGINKLKNIYLAAIAGLFLIEVLMMSHKGKKRLIFKQELTSMLFLAAGFAILSIYYAYVNGGLYSVTVEGLYRIVFPVVIAFCILNVMQHDDIFIMLKGTFWIMFISYLCANLGNLSSFSLRFWDSTASGTESNFYSPVAIAFCCAFCCWYRKHIYMLLSVFFVLLTFKRIMIFFALFWFFTGGILKKAKDLPRFFVPIFGVAFLLVSWFYYLTMMGQFDDILRSSIGETANSFSMGRAWMMQSAQKNFVSHGFYSTTLNARAMEMDIPMIYIEMGILAVALTIFCILRMVERNWSVFTVCVFILLELLTSHWFDISSYWLIAYITIGSIKFDGQRLTAEKNIVSNAHINCR